MREALAARPDHDFVAGPAPARRARPPAKGRPRARENLLRRSLAFARRYPLELAIAAGLVTAVAAIAYNALVLQTARHPAPWFSRRAEISVPPARPVPAVPPAMPTAAPPAPAAPAVAPPLPPRAARDSIGDLIRSAGEVTPPPRPTALPAVAPTAVAAIKRDPIGDMIRLGAPVPIPPAPVGRSTTPLTAAQTALVKLGYLSAKPDGVAGPQTRQAIERFERDRKLPITGELQPRTARELAAASGVAID